MPATAVIIATIGRPEVLTGTVQRILGKQTFKPDILIVSCKDAEDCGSAADWPGVRVVTGPPGLAAQRNTALEVLPDSIDIVTFFDDDFVPAADWLEVVVQLFQNEPSIAGVTGEVIADGIKGPGLNFEHADRLIDFLKIAEASPLIEQYSPYGCNMAFRRSAIHGMHFDEKLVLYGWLEDRDFGASLAARGGRIVKCAQARGVHMGVKRGRISGLRLGYSQIVNPIYMMKKGTMTPQETCGQIFRNLCSNLFKCAMPEKFIDRRGRLLGNLIGISDVLRGRINPQRAAKVGKSF
uniref:glycosyltransferase family 2 protein n=1 Tax=Methylobacterium sp. B34 TaxID=95563 RepID=UPI0005B2AA5C